LTAQNFIKDLQTNYRTKYNQVQHKYIMAWLQKNESRMNVIFAETLKTFAPTSTKPIPGIYDFEQALIVVKTQWERPELQPPEVLQIDEDMVKGKKAAAMLREVFEPLCKAKNINFEKREAESMTDTIKRLAAEKRVRHGL